MKKIIMALCFVLAFVTISNSAESYAGMALGGQHKLGKIGMLAHVLFPDSTVANVIDADPNALFLCIKRNKSLNVTFLWRSKKEFVISSLPVSKIRIRQDVNVVEPYVIFKWKASYGSAYVPMDTIMTDNVIYAIFVCKEEVWNPSKVSPKIKVEKPLKLEKDDFSFLDTVKQRPCQFLLSCIL